MSTLLHNYQIQKLLPHRYPFQLVDQIVEFESGKSIIGVKSVGIGEPALQGHFPGFPIFPGVLLVEAMGQACALLLELTRQNWKSGQILEETSNSDAVGVLGGMKVKLVTPVLPGTKVYLSAKLDWSMGPASSLKVKAYNKDTVFASGSITVAMANKAILIPQTKENLVEA